MSCSCNRVYFLGVYSEMHLENPLVISGNFSLRVSAEKQYVCTKVAALYTIILIGKKQCFLNIFN